jgi:hypothetical protein
MSNIVPFKIASVSSEDEDYEVKELLSPGPTSRGWASSQYCIYPQVRQLKCANYDHTLIKKLIKYRFQDLTLQLDSRTAIERIQILVSSSMIASAIEFYIGDDKTNPDDPDFSKAKFLSLGEVKFSDSKNSDLEGRQFQTIELGHGEGQIKASFVKLLMKHNHINKGNEYNQVGLMGVSIVGLPDKARPGKNRSRRGSRIDELSVVPRRQDLAFLMYTDKDIVEVTV